MKIKRYIILTKQRGEVWELYSSYSFYSTAKEAIDDFCRCLTIGAVNNATGVKIGDAYEYRLYSNGSTVVKDSCPHCFWVKCKKNGWVKVVKIEIDIPELEKE